MIYSKNNDANVISTEDVFKLSITFRFFLFNEKRLLFIVPRLFVPTVLAYTLSN